MYDLEKIISFSPEEIKILIGLGGVAEEAKQVAELIEKVYRFKINEDKREVWHDDDEEKGFEYITHSGYWQARYKDRHYNVCVDSDSIFELYEAEWLIENGYAMEFDEHGKRTEYGKRKLMAGYFKAFVRRTEGLLEETCN